MKCSLRPRDTSQTCGFRVRMVSLSHASPHPVNVEVENVCIECARPSCFRKQDRVWQLYIIHPNARLHLKRENKHSTKPCRASHISAELDVKITHLFANSSIICCKTYIIAAATPVFNICPRFYPYCYPKDEAFEHSVSADCMSILIPDYHPLRIALAIVNSVSPSMIFFNSPDSHPICLICPIRPIRIRRLIQRRHPGASSLYKDSKSRQFQQLTAMQYL